MPAMQSTRPAASGPLSASEPGVSGEFVDLKGERYYVIRNVDRMAPFFVSLISSDDHWLFASSTGGLTAGRVSPDTALFPYITVDKIHDSTAHTGCLTLLHVHRNGHTFRWRPLADVRDAELATSRNLYKSVLGNRLCFEEVNHDLELTYRYTWLTSDRYGFVRHSELINHGDTPVRVDVVDGLRNLLPAGTPRFTQTNSSNLVDAYKWTELDESGLVLLTLYSGITDRAEPCESLRANVVHSLGLDSPRILISEQQLSAIESGALPESRTLTRGIRGAFLLNSSIEIAGGGSREWRIIANTEQSQAKVVELRHELREPQKLANSIAMSVADGADALARIMASSDAFQRTDEENVSAHHYSNVLFNVLRGGIFFAQYGVSGHDFRHTIKSFNKKVYETHESLLRGLPDKLSAAELAHIVTDTGDPQLARLSAEYLPITFGRRHGDPSRPWNQFAIRLRDSEGFALLSYEGNWRDIFQNWEALALSFPEFTESMIAKFVNASTMDGYNPYRITKDGIDWEVEDPDDPWSYIGYWGDHQIIYLQKFLELSRRFHPGRLTELLHRDLFCYANVPYRIRSLPALLRNPKETVDYDDALADRIGERLEQIGADGKLVLDGEGAVYQVNLLEKLLVPLLSKLGNLVVDGGIWMNTQRPEWNDANNALVGQGLSMVTLYYLRRYVHFLDDLLAGGTGETRLSAEIGRWLADTATVLAGLAPELGNGPVPPEVRRQVLVDLGDAAARYRETVYRQEGFSGRHEQPIEPIRTMLRDALAAIDHSIATNRRDDGLYHAYNLLELDQHGLDLSRLYPMLEGQVAALSAGAIPADEAIEVLEALFASKVYRPDQQSFMLYPDRDLPSFLDKNRIPEESLGTIPLAARMLEVDDRRVILRDADGCYRFHADLVNKGSLDDALDALVDEYGVAVDEAREPLGKLYETVFNHQAFTGRSGTMFGFEGLGCVYWHMVAKLLLAVQENYFAAVDSGDDAGTVRRLGEIYYRIRHGIGFNKTPAEFGAFPIDPYSHTPRHAGAQQPGMTGQVKEEIITRFGELGIRVTGGKISFAPSLLRRQEFLTGPAAYRYVDVDEDWQEIALPPASLAFTWCQVPIVYRLVDASEASLRATLGDGSVETVDGADLPEVLCSSLFRRDGRLRRIDVDIPSSTLFSL